MPASPAASLAPGCSWTRGRQIQWHCQAWKTNSGDPAGRERAAPTAPPRDAPAPPPGDSGEHSFPSGAAGLSWLQGRWDGIGWDVIPHGIPSPASSTRPVRHCEAVMGWNAYAGRCVMGTAPSTNEVWARQHLASGFLTAPVLSLTEFPSNSAGSVTQGKIFSKVCTLPLT